MPKGWSSGELLTWIWLLILTFLFNGLLGNSLSETVKIGADTTVITSDTVLSAGTTVITSDTLLSADTTISSVISDTSAPKKSSDVIEDLIKRTARDSIVQDLPAKKVYMYGDAEINYQDITLKANYIEVNFNTNTVYATFTLDSTGKKIGIPEFTENKQSFKAKEITYDFKTEKGIIRNVLTEDDRSEFGKPGC